MQNSSGKRIEASQGDLNEVIKATGTVDAQIQGLAGRGASEEVSAVGFCLGSGLFGSYI